MSQWRTAGQLSLYKRAKEPQKHENAKKTVRLTTNQTRSEISMVLQYSVSYKRAP